MNKARKFVIPLVLCTVIILLSACCICQYCAIQKGKILSLNHSFYYMKEIIVEEEENGFNNWGNKINHLFILQDSAPNHQKGMGDYNEVKTLIFKVSQIENPKSSDAKKILKEAKEARVSWNTKSWKWGVNLEK
ncbi:hypothetical protein M2140_000716 [Clostridiales Family XIII bacterium PM5-7]